MPGPRRAGRVVSGSPVVRAVESIGVDVTSTASPRGTGAGTIPLMHRRRAELAAERVRNVLLAERLATGPVAAVRALLAVQSQEHAFSRWTLGQRLAGRPVEEDVRRAVDDGLVVRTHVLRPTWHYVLAEDLRWLQDLTAERVLRASAGWFRNHGVDDAFLGRAREALHRALEGGRHSTREELRGALAAEGLDVSGQRMTIVMFDAEMRGLVCSGPLAGPHHTYALVEERVPPTPRLEPEEATARLLTRYLAGHGPATLKDLRWWCGLTLTQLRAAAEDLGDALEREVVGGVEYLRLAGDPGPSDPSLVTVPAAPRFQLLQVFDELFVGYSETRRLLDPDGEFGAVLETGFGELAHVVVEGDRLAGRWRQDRRGKAVELTVQLTRPVSREDREALEEAAARYGAFLGKETSVTVRTGPRG